jgi:hypothetical protein
MKIKCNALFPGEIVEAVLVEQASQTSRTQAEVRLEVSGGAPIQLSPPGAMGAEIVEATPAEWSALEAAGYQLNRVTIG